MTQVLPSARSGIQELAVFTCLLALGVGESSFGSTPTAGGLAQLRQRCTRAPSKTVLRKLTLVATVGRFWKTTTIHTGFHSEAGIKAKEEAGLNVLRTPKRTPQINMCDYALWKEVEKRVRAQEKRFPPAFREPCLAFLKRLRRTALRLLCSFINSSLKNMRIRCQRLAAAKGGHFEEGGQHR